MANRMKRHIWLIAIVAALFVLQAPLCALACNESAETDSPTTSEPPCHENPSDSSPIGESNAHEDCACAFAPETVVSQPIDFAQTMPVVIFVSRAVRLELIDSSRGQDPMDARDADLPPPDILLLKSTLII